MADDIDRVIIAGSRSIEDREVFARAVMDSRLPVSNDPSETVEVVHGGCPEGVDAFAAAWADAYDWDTTVFSPWDPDSASDYTWDEHGKAAGPRRNAQMAAYADALLAIWDGESRGTKSMIDVALVHALDVDVVVVGDG